MGSAAADSCGMMLGRCCLCCTFGADGVESGTGGSCLGGWVMTGSAASRAALAVEVGLASPPPDNLRGGPDGGGKDGW